jgi:lipopolysaccharide/colanic/teichoic acid biosynthesis glycosyltransferase
MNQIPAEARALGAKSSPVTARPYAVIKRSIDLTGSLLLLIVLSPVLLLLVLAVEIESPGPVFFQQLRIGKGGKRFGLYKFRTMRRQPTGKDLTGEHTALNGHDEDITRVELPQLLNILRGEMSFIGPRPAVLAHEQYYTDWHLKRLDITPGVTGLAQVCGRNHIPWGWRVALDRYYVDHAGFSLDWAIFWKTFYVVLAGLGAEGPEDFYFDFTPPNGGVLEELSNLGVYRCFLRAPGANGKH